MGRRQVEHQQYCDFLRKTLVELKINFEIHHNKTRTSSAQFSLFSLSLHGQTARTWSHTKKKRIINKFVSNHRVYSFSPPYQIRWRYFSITENYRMETFFSVDCVQIRNTTHVIFILWRISCTLKLLWQFPEFYFQSAQNILLWRILCYFLVKFSLPRTICR